MKRGRIIGIVAGAVVMVAAGGALAWWLTSRPASPTDVATRYLEALADGDADAAVALVDADEDTARDAVTAYDSVLALPTDVSVGTTTEKDSTATVEVTYALDGTEVARTLALTRSGGTWLVSSGLGTVTVDSTMGDAMRIGSLQTDVGASVSLLPGLYLTVALPDAILQGSADVAVAPGEDAQAAVEASVSPGAAAIVQEQIDAYAETCAQPATAVPANCGLRVPWGADLATLTNLTFRVEKTPQVAISPDATAFDATGGVIVATATGKPRAGGQSSFTYRADDWALRGSLTFTGPSLVVAVR